MSSFRLRAALALIALLAACGAEPTTSSPPSTSTPESEQESGPAAEAIETPQAPATSTSPAQAPREAFEEVALFADVSPTRLRGRVLSRRSAQPWGDVWVRLESAGHSETIRATSAGYFLASKDLPEGPLTARIGLDEEGPWVGSEGQSLDHEALGADQRLHRLRVDAGPSFELEFLEEASLEPERWEARLIERNERGGMRPWSWQVLRTGNLPRLRYLDREWPLDEEWRVFVELRLRNKDWFARAPVESSAGDRGRALVLDLVQYAAFSGRIIDGQGAVQAGVQVSLHAQSGSETPLFDRQPWVTWSALDGGFAFPPQIEPGHYHLQIDSEWRETVQLELDLEGGHRPGYEVILEEVEASAEMPVAIVGSGEGSLPEVILSLVSLDDESVRRCLHTRLKSPMKGFIEAGGVGHGMLFQQLREGRYELSIFPVDGRRYEPTRIEVQLPLQIEGVLFVEVNAERPRRVGFDVRDAQTELVLPEYLLRVFGDDWWFPEASRVAKGGQFSQLVTDGLANRWMLWAEGYQPAYGSWNDLEAAAPEDSQDESRIAVGLSPGWGAELVLRDGGAGLPSARLDSWQAVALVHQAQPVEGVLVIADGRLVGQSDRDGRVRLELDSVPRELELFKEGWRALGARASGGNGVQRMDVLNEKRSAVVWMLEEQ